MRKNICLTRLLPVIILLAMSLWCWGCGGSTVKPGRDYVEVGYYYNQGIRAWSIYLPQADEDTARKVADKYFEYNENNTGWHFNMEAPGPHSCAIQFFDSLDHTPTFEYDTQLNGLQKRHQVAVFWYDKDSGEKIFKWIGRRDDSEEIDTLEFQLG